MLRSPIRCNWLSFCCAERVSETHRRSTPMSWPIHGILSADTVCSIGQYLLILSGSVYLTWVGYILCTRYHRIAGGFLAKTVVLNFLRTRSCMNELISLTHMVHCSYSVPAPDSSAGVVYTAAVIVPVSSESGADFIEVNTC